MIAAFRKRLSDDRQGYIWSPRAISTAVDGCLHNQPSTDQFVAGPRRYATEGHL
jgi:hypothetical protein